MTDKIIKTLRLKKILVEKIKKIAKAERRSFNNMAEVMLIEQVNKRNDHD